jgi:alkanesulfonate monooxygenase SsuD/methylene tetrahydromethanopterin reductase-like flavin-dependent oxidoreductase (luciferase family)
MEVGLYFDLRNPAPWERPWSDLYEETLELIEWAEELGIDSAWFTEHHFFEDGYLPQPFTFAAAVAARTKRIRIGTAIAIAALRPAVDVAEQGAIVDILSGGRFELGLGAGYVAREFEAFGQPIKGRFPALEDRAREVRRLWSEGGITPPPVQERIPIWIGAQGPRGARIAGRLGEGLLWLGDELQAPYREALAAGGHDPDDARVSGLANVVLSRDPERAWSRIAPHLEYQWTSYGANARRRTSSTERAARALDRPLDQVMSVRRADPERLRSSGPVMNAPAFDVVTASEAERRLRVWLDDLPVRHVYFWASIAGMPTDLVREHVELLAGELAPALAELGRPAPR